MSKPTGPCTLCGSKHTSSGWRRLPECAGELAGKDGCNACYVALTKASGKYDEAGIRELMASRCALKGVTGVARRRLAHTRRASSSATATLPCAPPREPPLPRSFTELLMGVAPAGTAGAADAAGAAGTAGASASGPSSAPAAGPAQRTRRALAGASHASRAHSSGSSAPAAQTTMQPSPEPQQQQPVAQPAAATAQAAQQQQGSPGPAASVAPPAAEVQPVAIQMLEEWRALTAACTSQVSAQEKRAGQQAWFSAHQLVGRGAVLVGFLPALELLLPGTRRSPDPAGVLFVCACPAPLRELRGARDTGHTLRLVVYCPITGQLMVCRDQVRREENCLYRHPRHDKWAWDSSEGWKLLFPEPSHYGPQLQMFRHALAMFGTITAAPPAGAQQTFWVGHAQQQQAQQSQQQQQQQEQQEHQEKQPAHGPAQMPLHPLVPPPPPQQQQLGMAHVPEWPGLKLAQPSPSASPVQAPAGQQLEGSQWPGSPVSVRSPSSVQQPFGSAAYTTSPASHTPAAPPMWQTSTPTMQQAQLLPMPAAPLYTPGPRPMLHAPAPPLPLPQLMWPAASSPAQLQPAACFQPQPPPQPLLPPPAGMDLPWELPGTAPASPAAPLQGSLFHSGPITPGSSLPLPAEPLSASQLAQQAQQGLQVPPELEFGLLDLTKADDFQQMLDSMWGDQVGQEEAGAAPAAAESVGASP